MEPVTHILTGACLARAGLNRRAAYATLAMAVAAEFPDIDTLWSLRGPVASFTHHRGFTHTFLAVPLEAAIVVGGVYAWHWWRVSRRPAAAEKLAAPVRWGVLYGLVLLALLSHLLLDFTNNYGLRPFFPWNAHWYAGSIVFIFDPLIFALLLVPFLLPPLLGLVGSEVGAARAKFRGRGSAITVLLLIACVWTARSVAHDRAQTLAMAQSIGVQQQPLSTADANDAAPPPDDGPLTYLQPQRVLSNPDPFNPLRWHVVSDLGDFYQLSEINLGTSVVTTSPVRFPKPARTPAVLAAQASPLGRAYMDWSPMPIVTSSRPGEHAAGHTVVTFRDPRFMGDVALVRSLKTPPLTATVELDQSLRVVRQTMDGSAQLEAPDKTPADGR